MGTRGRAAWLPIAGLLVITGCSSTRVPTSPDVLYSDNSEAALALQVPPDLTDVSDSEQFVLPGVAGGAVTRNTLLPSFDGLSFVREGEQSWLALAQAPEAIWPRLLEFLRAENYTVEQTEPVAGTLFTRWKPVSAEGGGSLLRNLVGAELTAERIGFRLERDGEGASRLFARRQTGPEDVLEDGASGDLPWTDSANSPELTAGLLQRLLVFLGVEAQRAEGLLDQAARDAVLTDAVLQTSSVGSQILHHRGYLSSLRDLQRALEALDYTVVNSDRSVGRIEFSANAEQNDDGPALRVNVEPVHVSAALVSLSDGEGQRLDAERERSLLAALREQLV